MENQNDKVDSTKAENIKPEETGEEIKYFECATCSLKEAYQYFGRKPENFKRYYKLCEDSYVIEDPFQPPKNGEILILGSHCVKCKKSVCKDPQCSFFYEKTYCTLCAKSNVNIFPPSVREKLNKIVVS